MTTVFVAQNNYIPVGQQECYLETPSDNQSIIKCLDNYQLKENLEILAVVFLAFLVCWVAIKYITHYLNGDDLP